jgi:ADP-dependent NAD(P)H-hydrate dehydratase / NAD(P)H-hydrate epimerase
MSTIPVLSPEQSNAWDKRSIAAGVELATLMESAGRAVAAVLVDRYAHLLRSGVLVAVGPGNNGGDGWVAARALHRLEIPVWVASTGPGAELRERMAALARAEGVREVAPDGPWPGAGVAVDALLGTGASGAPRPAIATLLARLLDLEVPVVAIDGPTGIDLLTGMVHGPTRADLTVTFGGFRRGHLLARDEVGDLVVVDIGHSLPDPVWPTVVTDADASEWLPRFKAAAHKGNRGRVVVVGGDAGMTGAIRMSARAAFASGAGLVHVVAPAETVSLLVQAEPDVQTLVQAFDQRPSPALLELIGRADAVVIGPGLGRQAGRSELVFAILDAASRVVLDADALVVLAGAVTQLRTLAAARAFVLTPHPGEFRTLFPDLAAKRELDPWAAAAAACDQVGSTILLKGVPTVITSPGKHTRTVVAGNPGLATGGSGDILSGVIGAALAAGVEPDTAAALGAQVLGRAADIGARRHTARSLRPMDVVNAFPDLWREWEVTRLARPTPRAPILFELPRPETT